MNSSMLASWDGWVVLFFFWHEECNMDSIDRMAVITMEKRVLETMGENNANQERCLRIEFVNVA